MGVLTNQLRLDRAADVASQTVADEAILINLKTGVYYSLNPVGAAFWAALDGRRTVAEHARAIAAEYGVDESVVQGDLLELAGDLLRERLVGIVGD
jgi:hypothetical protein